MQSSASFAYRANRTDDCVVVASDVNAEVGETRCPGKDAGRDIAGAEILKDVSAPVAEARC